MTSRNLWTMFGAAVVALALVGAFCTPQAPAATYTWEGKDATNPTHWSVPANWDLAAVPTAVDTALFDATHAYDTTYVSPGVVDLQGGTGLAAKVEFQNVYPSPVLFFNISNGTLELGDGVNPAEIEHQAVPAIPASRSEISADRHAQPRPGRQQRAPGTDRPDGLVRRRHPAGDNAGHHLRAGGRPR